MPQAIIGAVITAGISTAVTAATVGFATTQMFLGFAAKTAMAFFARSFVTSLVLGAVSQALGKKPSAGALSSGQTITARQAVAAHNIIYGRTRVGGVYVHMEGTNDNKYLHMVVALAGHEIDAVEEIYFNDELVTLDGSDFGYGGKARIKFKLGTDDQTAFSDLVSESGAGWGNNHRLRGIACAYIRLEFDQDKFPHGVPNFSFVVRGKKVYDPRSGQTVWSANPALCLNDYLTSTRYGLGIVYANEINSTTLIAAANVCDEAVALDAGGTEARYECHGVISTANAPSDVITSMLSSMAGKVVFSGGKWRFLAGVYYTPTLSFDEGDLRGGFRVQSLVSRRENFNCIKGVFSSKDENYINTDFPTIVSATYIAQDNGETVYKNIQLPFTTSPSMAQRLAKIELLRARQQITLTLPLKLQGLQANVGDIIQVNNTRMGWTNKAFEVVSMQMALGEQLGVDVELREISTDVFAWETSEEQTYDPAPNTNLPNAFVVAPVTDLTLAAQTLLSPDGTSQAGILVTWTPPLNAFVERYEVQYIRGSSNFDWGLITDASTATTDHGSIAASATGGADYGVITEVTSTAEPQYNSVFVTTPYYFINGAVAGAEYAVRVRAINVMGVRSAWSTSNQTTYGDTTAPDAPSGLTASGGYRQITVSWINPSVSDFDYVEIFGNIVDNFSTATRIAVLRGSMFVDSPLAINYTKYYWVRAVDRSGNISGETASVNATTEFVDSDSFSAEVLNLFSEAGAYGIEPVASLPATGDFDGQIKFDTTNNKLWRWDATGGVWTDDIFSITSGSVDAASFAAGIEPIAIESSLPNPTGYTGPQVVFLTTDNKIYRYTGTAWVASVSTSDLSGTLGSNLFSNSIRPVEVVGALPSTGNFAGRVAVLTTDGKLYRHNGTAWTAAVPTADLSGTVSNAQISGLAASKITGTLSDAQIAELSAAKLTGQITETQITDGAISTGKLSASAVTAEKLAASSVTADALAANSVTAGAISAGAIEAAAISAGAIEASALAAGSVTADALAANSVDTDALVANSITAAKISTGAITADALAANSVSASALQADSVVAGKIAAAAISTSALFVDGVIQSSHIEAATIQGDRIAANTITGGLIAASGIITNTAQIDDGLITNAKISNLSADRIVADKIDSRGLSIKDADGNIILAAGATPSLNVPGINYFNQSTAPYDYTVVKAGDTWKTSTDQYKATANLGATFQEFAEKCYLAIASYITFGLPSTKLDSVLQHFLYNQDNGSFKAGDINNSGAVDISDSTRWGVVAGGGGTGAENTWATDVWNLAKAKYVSVWELASTVGAVLDDGLGGTNITGQITSSNVSTWIAAAAIDTAYIKDAAVNTLKIAGQAVTIPSSAANAGVVRGTSDNDVWFDAISVSVTTTGAKVYISTSAQPVSGIYTYAGDNYYYHPYGYRLLRDSTVLLSGQITSAAEFKFLTAAFAYSETPAAGTYTYKLQFYIKIPVGTNPTPSGFTSYAGVEARSIFVIETKR